MYLSGRRSYDTHLQITDSSRYRDAVNRLKRILYDRPSYAFDVPRGRSPLRESPTDAIRENLREFPKDIALLEDKNEMIKEIAGDDIENSMTGVMELLKRQEDLISHQEKENTFLKTELISMSESVKEMAEQNESFRKRLTETLLQMENTQELSSVSDEKEKMDEIIGNLKEERERLVECVQIQEETIEVLHRRQTESMEKVKQAVNLAEESHRLSDKVKESGESAKKHLQNEAESAFDKVRHLKHQLQVALENESKYQALLKDQEHHIAKLEEERRQDESERKKQELTEHDQVKELQKQVIDLENKKERLEKLLKDQRNTSDETFKRLNALLDRRNIETESYNKSRIALERQISDLRLENQKLLQTVNDIAKERMSHTDDAKYAKRVSNLIPEVLENKEQITEIKSSVKKNEISINNLQKEVKSVRKDMAEGFEGLKENIKTISSTDNGTVRRDTYEPYFRKTEEKRSSSMLENQNTHEKEQILTIPLNKSSKINPNIPETVNTVNEEKVEDKFPKEYTCLNTDKLIPSSLSRSDRVEQFENERQDNIPIEDSQDGTLVSEIQERDAFMDNEKPDEPYIEKNSKNNVELSLTDKATNNEQKIQQTSSPDNLKGDENILELKQDVIQVDNNEYMPQNEGDGNMEDGDKPEENEDVNKTQNEDAKMKDEEKREDNEDINITQNEDVKPNEEENPEEHDVNITQNEDGKTNDEEKSEEIEEVSNSQNEGEEQIQDEEDKLEHIEVREEVNEVEEHEESTRNSPSTESPGEDEMIPSPSCSHTSD